MSTTCCRILRIGILFAVCVFEFLDAPRFCGNAPASEKNDNSIPDFFFDSADETAKSSVFKNPLLYDADVVSVDGSLWYTWLEFKPGKGDEIWFGSRKGEEWQSSVKVSETPGDFARPTLTRDGTGQLWLSYEAEVDRQWDVLAVRLDKGKPAGKIQRVSPGKGADINHDAAGDPKGGIWISWQSDQDGQFDILARRVNETDLGETENVSSSRTGDWHPAIAVGPDGAVHVAWDSYDGQSFDVFVRSFQDNKWGAATRLTDSPAFEGRADIAVDGEGRVWIAWEEGGENWGKPYRGINTLKVTDQIGPLHRLRKLRVATLLNGDVKPALPMPAFKQSQFRRAVTAGVKEAGVFYERVKLTIDRNERVWVAYRHYYTPWLGVTHRSHIEEGWGVYARYLTADGWSPLQRFDVGQGDGTQRFEFAPHDDGVAAVWTTGRTHRTANKRPRGIAAATISGKGPAPKLSPNRRRNHKSEAEAERPLKPKPELVDKQEYRLYFGDLHRHTDLSLCRVPLDGTIDDAYRYAIEVVQLDFLGITDHSRDIAMGNTLSQLWWRSRKQVYRHQLGTNFFPFYAYERSHGNTADHNVISLRDDMLRPHTYPVPKFWQELDRDTMTIPHQPIRRDTWKYQNDKLRPLVEIFQGCRDSSIEEHVHRGLGKGYHLGFIASSDHLSTSSSYSCVWAKDASRESIFRAMQARRTFGATAKMRLVVRAGDHWMGEIIDADRMPEITLDAQTTVPIRSVNLIVDGKSHETISPNKRHVELRRQLELTGQHYVYFHVVQSDGNEGWSSPLWVNIGAAKKN